MNWTVEGGEMSDREKDTPEQPEDEADADAEELNLGELGAVFGGWHPAPPPLDPPSDSNPSDGA